MTLVEKRLLPGRLTIGHRTLPFLAVAPHLSAGKT
jgi:hypothetical protein